MFIKYIIQNNDDLETIAKKFNTTPNNILDINNIAFPDSLKEGMEIIVPNSKEYYAIYTVKNGDNLYQIAKKYNINPTLLAAINGIGENSFIYPNQELMIPKSGYSYYITKEGDTLDLVSNIFNSSINKLINENTIYLMEGQLLVHKK